MKVNLGIFLLLADSLSIQLVEAVGDDLQPESVVPSVVYEINK